MVPDSFYGLDVTARFIQLRLVDSNSTEEQRQRAFKTIKEMDYQDFLNTLYWKTIRDYAVERYVGNCQSCLSSRAVNVHHKTYENHGREHLHLGDLMPVCRTCHEILHEKKDRGEINNRAETLFESMHRKISSLRPSL